MGRAPHAESRGPALPGPRRALPGPPAVTSSQLCKRHGLRGWSPLGMRPGLCTIRSAAPHGPALPCPAAALESAPHRPGPQKAAGREGRPCREGLHGVQAGVSTCWGLPASWVSLGRRAGTETHLLESDDPENRVDSKREGLLILKRCLHLMGFSIGVTEKLVFSKFPPILFHQIPAVTQRRDSASAAGTISL